MTDAEIQAEAHRIATTCLHTGSAEAEIAKALRLAATEATGLTAYTCASALERAGDQSGDPAADVAWRGYRNGSNYKPGDDRSTFLAGFFLGRAVENARLTDD